MLDDDLRGTLDDMVSENAVLGSVFLLDVKCLLNFNATILQIS